MQIIVAGPTQRNTTTHVHTYSHHQFRGTSYPNVHVFEEAEVIKENLHMHRKNMQTPHREGPVFFGPP